MYKLSKRTRACKLFQPEGRGGKHPSSPCSHHYGNCLLLRSQFSTLGRRNWDGPECGQRGDGSQRGHPVFWRLQSDIAISRKFPFGSPVGLSLCNQGRAQGPSVLQQSERSHRAEPSDYVAQRCRQGAALLSAAQGRSFFFFRDFQIAMPKLKIKKC